MKNLFLTGIAILILSSCTTIKDKTKNIKILKECDGSETGKTLAEVLCKKKK